MQSYAVSNQVLSMIGFKIYSFHYLTGNVSLHGLEDYLSTLYKCKKFLSFLCLPILFFYILFFFSFFIPVTSGKLTVTISHCIPEQTGTFDCKNKQLTLDCGEKNIKFKRFCKFTANDPYCTKPDNDAKIQLLTAKARRCNGYKNCKLNLAQQCQVNGNPKLSYVFQCCPSAGECN